MSDFICSSADKPLEIFISNCGEETSHHRMVSQQNKCGYGLQGVCCRLCSNGPCRLSPAKPRGVCGADADTIAMRGFLRQVAAGSGCYTHVVENTAKRLKELAEECKSSNIPKRACGWPQEKMKNRESIKKLARILDVGCGEKECGSCGCVCADTAIALMSVRVPSV